jgi:2-oxoglutarate ferredoxin oxidoreductase subunit beta
MFEPYIQDPERVRLLHHKRGLSISPALAEIYSNQLEHDPRDLAAARAVASTHDPIPVGILYHNPDVPCYEDVRGGGEERSPARIRAGLEAEFDKFTIWPHAAHAAPSPDAG